MTKFVRANFEYHGGYLTYQGKFVARFKYQKKDKPGFVSFLIKNVEVEEYFTAIDLPIQGGLGLAPMAVLKAKGYISKTVADMLKYSGYPATEAGYRAYIDQQVAIGQARVAQMKEAA